MAVLALTDAYISIGGSVVSSSGNKVELDATVEELDTTTFGQTWKTRIGGLKDGTLAVDFVQDFANSALDSIFWPFLGTVQAFEIRPTSGSASTSNPKWTGSIFIKEWKPLGNGVGELATVSVSFPTTGTVTRATS